MDEVERKSVMLDILYEDKDILVVVKPAGVESQTSRRLEFVLTKRRFVY